MKVAAPSDKRFRRSHVSPARKRSLLPSWRVAALAAAGCASALFGFYWLTGTVLQSGALTVSRITVTGTSRMSRGEVLALLDGIRGQNMITVDLEEWRQKLLTSPWVDDAALRRQLPGTLAVAISERSPIGIGRIDGSLYLIDHRGMVIDEFGPNYSDFDLPIIDGLAAAPQPGGGLVDEGRALLAGRLLADLQRHPALAGRVSQVDVTDARDATVILKGDTAMVRVGTEHFVERLQSYLDLMPALRERVPLIDYVDLRFDERVYVKPQAAGSRLRATGTAGSR